MLNFLKETSFPNFVGSPVNEQRTNDLLNKQTIASSGVVI
jgi:hypothetical protein